MNKIRNLSIGVICVIISQACMLKHTVDRTVNNYYTNRRVILASDTSSRILLNTREIQPQNSYCKAHYDSFFTVPLIIYYYSKEIICCNVNPTLLVNSVVNSLNTLAENDENLDYFSGKNIELHFHKVPTVFYHRHRSHFLFNPFPLIGLFVIHYHPRSELYNHDDYVHLTYVVRDKNTQQIIKEGEIQHLLPGIYRLMNSEKKTQFIEDFYKVYDDNMLNTGTGIAMEIINKLK